MAQNIKQILGIEKTNYGNSKVIYNVIPLSAPVGALGGVASAVSSASLKVLSVAKTAITKHPFISTGTVITGASIASSKKAQTQIKEDVIPNLPKLPSDVFNFPKNVGAAYDNPSKESLSKILKESPITSSILGLALGYGVAKTALPFFPALSSYLTKEEIQKQTEEAKKQTDILKKQQDKGNIPSTDNKDVPATINNYYGDTPHVPTEPISSQTSVPAGTTVINDKETKVSEKTTSPSTKINVSLRYPKDINRCHCLHKHKKRHKHGCYR